MEGLLPNREVCKNCVSLLFALHFVVFVQLILKKKKKRSLKLLRFRWFLIS